MSVRNWLQSSNSNESSESLQGLSSSACSSTPIIFTASKPISKRKSANANDLGVDHPKHVSLRAYPVSMFWVKKRCCNATWYQKVELVGIFCQV